MLYIHFVIEIFQHKGLKRFFETESKARIDVDYAAKLSRQLSRLNQAKVLGDMDSRVASSIEMAFRLERWLGVEQGGRADLWLEEQLAYDLWQARHIIQVA